MTLGGRGAAAARPARASGARLPRGAPATAKPAITGQTLAAPVDARGLTCKNGAPRTSESPGLRSCPGALGRAGRYQMTLA